jgi:DNA-binding FadR family transcriptional regulator
MATTSLKAQPSEGRLSERAQRVIKDYVVAHGLGPGDPLPPEGRLAQELEISRTALREAVKALESLGILEARAGVGLFVRSFSFDPILENLGYSLLVDGHQVADLLAVRKHLEIGFVAQAATAVTPAQLRVLRSAVDRMGERAALERGRGEFPEEDRFFHRTLYAGLDNAILLKLLDVYWEVYTRLRGGLHLEERDPVASWEHHRRVVEALEAGDPAGASAAMAVHFENIERRLRHARVGRPRAE